MNIYARTIAHTYTHTCARAHTRARTHTKYTCTHKNTYTNTRTYTHSSLKSLFVLASDTSKCSHTFRGHVFKLFLPKPRTDMLKNSFVYRVITVWNSLSQTACKAGTLSMFKLN